MRVGNYKLVVRLLNSVRAPNLILSTRLLFRTSVHVNAWFWNRAVKAFGTLPITAPVLESGLETGGRERV